jgi:hypothetical protein
MLRILAPLATLLLSSCPFDVPKCEWEVCAALCKIATPSAVWKTSYHTVGRSLLCKCHHGKGVTVYYLLNTCRETP